MKISDETRAELIAARRRKRSMPPAAKPTYRAYLAKRRRCTRALDRFGLSAHFVAVVQQQFGRAGIAMLPGLQSPRPRQRRAHEEP